MPGTMIHHLKRNVLKFVEELAKDISKINLLLILFLPFLILFLFKAKYFSKLVVQVKLHLQLYL